MNPMPQAAAPTPSAPADDGGKKKKIILGVAVGCLSLFTLCCVCPVTGYFGGNASRKGDVEDAVTEWLANVRAHDAAGAYAGMDRWYQGRNDLTDFTRSLATCRGVVTHTSAEIDEIKIDHPFDDFVIVRVNLTGGDVIGSERISMGMENEDGTWKVGTFYSMSDHRCDL